MMRERQICERSVFDGSVDDPRTLVHLYQQRVRAQLLAKAAVEAKREAWFTDFVGSLLASVQSLIQTVTSPAARPAPAPARAGLRLLPSTQVSF
ncbi:MAG: hypothetical protein AB7P40_01735 [Chloroflexota bacterium]